MRRREFITLVGGAAVWPSAASVQQPTMRVIGILSAETPASPYVEAMRVGLQELGYVDGRNVRYEYRWAEGNFERLPDLAVELVGLNVDVIVAFVTAASLAARKATAMIPIVMAFVSDPIGAGLIASLAHPGGNVTGTAGVTAILFAKQLELLKEITECQTFRRALQSGQRGVSGAAGKGSNSCGSDSRRRVTTP
jgi:putative ABC transport system substrate-binding protein